MDLRDAAQELYAILPKEFTARRAALAREAKEAGDKDLAKEIAGLAKPTSGAWAINVLAANRPEVIDGVVRFGASLRAAQENGDAEAFRELGQQRQGELTTAVHAAKDLATHLGAALSAAAAADVEQTFRAAMADAGAAAAVATGRLVRGLSGSGFEAVDLSGAVAGGGIEEAARVQRAPATEASAPRKKAPAAQEPRSKPQTKEEKPDETATSLAERRAAKRQAALAEAQSEFEAADKEAREAEDAATKAWDAVKKLERRRSGVQSDIEEARKRLASLEAELLGITRDTETAESDKKRAVRTATQLRRAADQARRRVERLG
ncbi:hypothetical protein ACIPY2_03500 [Paenarthrobacter sp. NPDC089675]|uniref:hypothetical protein n=1 Tax=Paenarthrobacter sp. NPDC089675 TaxID=3364376 RepID=UPI00381CF4AB